MSKENQWYPWIIQHVKWWHGEFSLDEVPKVYRTLVSLAMSVAHWHPDNPSRGGRSEMCPLCTQFHKEISAFDAIVEECQGCPLVEADQWCNDRNSIWMKWYHASRSAPPDASGFKRYCADRRADDVYEVLLSLYEEEYFRVMGEQDVYKIT